MRKRRRRRRKRRERKRRKSTERKKKRYQALFIRPETLSLRQQALLKIAKNRPISLTSYTSSGNIRSKAQYSLALSLLLIEQAN
jgi:hypothetical protein